MNTLHSTPFFWSVPNDDNRAFEGKELRCKFCEERNIFYDPEQYDTAASMLELIIALAYRCEYIMTDNGLNMSMKDWFWKILSNIGLDECTDMDYEESNVVKILDRIIDRSYLKNGKGGLFPLKRPKEDQRKVEIWYQMNAYLLENYYE